jgi:hypothetical protein
VQLKDELSKKFNMPAIFWKDVAYAASGFFGSQESEDGMYSKHFIAKPTGKG